MLYRETCQKRNVYWNSLLVRVRVKGVAEKEKAAVRGVAELECSSCETVRRAI